jgi:hypothetical protein
LNRDPPNLCFPSSWNYRHVPLCPAGFIIWCHFELSLVLLQSWFNKCSPGRGKGMDFLCTPGPEHRGLDFSPGYRLGWIPSSPPRPSTHTLPIMARPLLYVSFSACHPHLFKSYHLLTPYYPTFLFSLFPTGMTLSQGQESLFPVMFLAPCTCLTQICAQ